MPTVPTAAGPKQQNAGLPSARVETPQVAAPDVQLRPNLLSTPQLSNQKIDTPQFKTPLADPGALKAPQLGPGGGAQFVAAGAALGQVSDEIGRQVLAYQRQVNATVVDDALDQARQAALHLTYGTADASGQIVGGYANLKGEQAFRVKDGNGQDTSLDRMVGDGFDNQVKAIAASKLTNADQRAVFDAQVGNIRNQVISGALSHSDQQFQTYRNAVYTNGIKNDATAFALIDPTDRKAQQEALTQLDQKVATLGLFNGAPAAEVEQQQFLARTAAVGSMIQTAISGKNYAQASAVLNEYAEKIDPNDAAKYRLVLSGHVSTQVGEQLADAAFKKLGAPAYAVGDADRGYNINQALESRGKQTGPDGKLLTSSAGAFGVSQLTPDTAARYAKRLGHPEWAQVGPDGKAHGVATQTDQAGHDANAAIGKAVWGDLVGKFGGDVVKAAAAYNAGEGYLVGGTAPDGRKLEGALKWAARTGGDWRQYPEFKPETLARIDNVQKAMALGDGRPAKPAKSDLYAEIDRSTTDPDARTAGYARVDKMMAAADYDEREGKDSAMAEGLRVLSASNGDLNAVSPSLRAQIDPKDWEQLQTYGRNLNDGTYRTTDDATYYAVMQPEAIKKMTPADVQRAQLKLSKRDGDALQALWMDYRNPAPDKGPGSLDVSTVDNIIDVHLSSLGIDTKPNAKKNPDQAAYMGAVKGFVHRAILDVQAQTGQKLTNYDDIDKVVSQLFLKQQGWKKGWAGNTRGTQSILASGYKDIPVDIRGEVEDQLEHGPKNAQGQRVGRGLGRKPNQGEVLDAYFRRKFYGG